MPESDPSITRRSFVEKVALAAGITAGGGGAFRSLKTHVGSSVYHYTANR